MWLQQKRPKITNCTPHGPRGLFCRNTHLNLCHGTVGCEASSTGCCPYKNRVFWRFTLCKGCSHVPIWKYLCVCVKDAFFLHFAKLRALIFWNASFCSLVAFWAVRGFRPDFWPGSNLKIFVCVKNAFFLCFANCCVLVFWNALFL